MRGSLSLKRLRKVVHTVTVGSHTQVTGEVVGIVADEAVVGDDGKVDLDRLSPIIYDEEALVYRAVGPKASDAFKPGAAMRKKLRWAGAPALPYSDRPSR